MSRSNPVYPIALGVVLLVISFLVGGTTRDLILRVVGVVAILAGAGMWLVQRRGA
jgi:hypothetical protein